MDLQKTTTVLGDATPKEIKVERAKAIVTIVLTAAFNVANLYGYAVDADAIVKVVMTVISYALILWSWWKNQNITKEAATSQKLLKYLKADAKEDEKKAA